LLSALFIIVINVFVALLAVQFVWLLFIIIIHIFLAN